MRRIVWHLRSGRPCVQIALSLAISGEPCLRTLLADTGAGSRTSGIELILDENDCLLCGGLTGSSVTLRGAYIGSFPLYDLPIELPALGFVQNLRVVGVPSVPAGFDGIACFGFLNLFGYGNFGEPSQFGLER